jgi:hypothetical protein
MFIAGDQNRSHSEGVPCGQRDIAINILLLRSRTPTSRPTGLYSVNKK